jgi:hypothetical protein
VSVDGEEKVVVFRELLKKLLQPDDIAEIGP